MSLCPTCGNGEHPAESCPRKGELTKKRAAIAMTGGHRGDRDAPGGGSGQLLDFATLIASTTDNAAPTTASYRPKTTPGGGGGHAGYGRLFHRVKERCVLFIFHLLAFIVVDFTWFRFRVKECRVATLPLHINGDDGLVIGNP